MGLSEDMIIERALDLVNAKRAEKRSSKAFFTGTGAQSCGRGDEFRERPPQTHRSRIGRKVSTLRSCVLVFGRDTWDTPRDLPTRLIIARINLSPGNTSALPQRHFFMTFPHQDSPAGCVANQKDGGRPRRGCGQKRYPARSSASVRMRGGSCGKYKRPSVAATETRLHSL